MTRISRRSVLKSGLTLAAAPVWGSLFPSTGLAYPGHRNPHLRAGEPARCEPGAFTLVVLPDTQYYSRLFPDTFRAQTHWILENQVARNIQGVIHLGDVTDANSPAEWQNAVSALEVLEGKIPYFLTLGNHDYSQNGECRDRSTLFNDYFPLAMFQSRPSFGGVYDGEPDRMENSFHLLEAQGRRLMILTLEFGPRRDVVRWANEVVAAHPDRSVILVTHAYTFYDDRRHDWKRNGDKQPWNPHSYAIATSTRHDVLDGQELWTELVSRHDNFIFTLNGHVLGSGLGRVTSTAACGQEVHQLLVNFQMKARGGDGWLRLLEFSPDGKTVRVCDYSPTRDQRNVSSGNRFTLSIEYAGSDNS